MAYNTDTQYTSADDYFEKRGIDLSYELKNSNTDNPTKAVDIFIKNIEDQMNEYIVARFDKDDYDNNFDTDVFIKAVIYQIDYIRAHGDVSLTCDPLSILAPNAANVLKMAGMLNPSKEDRYYSTWV